MPGPGEQYPKIEDVMTPALRRKNLILAGLLVGFAASVFARTIYVMWPDITEEEIAAMERRHELRKLARQQGEEKKQE